MASPYNTGVKQKIYKTFNNFFFLVILREEYGEVNTFF